MMEPAYQIPLSEKQLAELGALAAILGQVDEILIRTVERLLNLNRQSANRIMGSSKVADNSSIWAEAIRNRTTDEDVLWLVEHAGKEIQAVSAGRNDFIHAWFEARVTAGLFAGRYFSPAYFGPGYFGGRRVVTARRVRNEKQRPLSDLLAIKNQAARLSCLVAHIDHLLTEGNTTATSPWFERLGPSLPPRPSPDAPERPARGRRRRSRT